MIDRLILFLIIWCFCCYFIGMYVGKIIHKVEAEKSLVLKGKAKPKQFLNGGKAVVLGKNCK